MMPDVPFLDLSLCERWGSMLCRTIDLAVEQN